MFWLIELQVSWKRSVKMPCAEQEDGADDDSGDAGDQQAVLDGGRAALVLADAGASAVTRSSRPRSGGNGQA